MQHNKELRVLKAAEYMVEHNATVRKTARAFLVSKSQLHKDMGEPLRSLDTVLYRKVCAVMQNNKRERHLRGGAATRAKYRAE